MHNAHNKGKCALHWWPRQQRLRQGNQLGGVTLQSHQPGLKWLLYHRGVSLMRMRQAHFMSHGVQHAVFWKNKCHNFRLASSDPVVTGAPVGDVHHPFGPQTTTMYIP